MTEARPATWKTIGITCTIFVLVFSKSCDLGPFATPTLKKVGVNFATFKKVDAHLCKKTSLAE